MSANKVLIIGLVGLPGAGKTTAARHLEKLGFIWITLSDFIREEATKEGLAEDRITLQDIGNRMRETYGPQVLAQLAHKKIRALGKKKIVIDGIRNLYEIAFLEVENNFTLVGITAPPKVRFRRLMKRKNRTFTGTYEEFLKHEKREDALGSKETGLRVRQCLKKSKYVLRNSTTEQEFKEAIEALALTLSLK